MVRFKAMMPLALVPISVCQAQQLELKPYQLNSGRVIYPKTAGPMIAPNMPKEKIWVLIYQTQLKISDLTPLESEAMEVWQEFRPKFETVAGITMAVLQADEKPTGQFFQSYNSFKFVITRKPDGSWEWLKGKANTPN